MDDLILKRIGGLIAAHSGIYVREQDYQALADKVWKRIKILGLKSLEDYYSLLWKELESGVVTVPKPNSDLFTFSQKSEWQDLYTILTINESYFFRDKNQFKLLTEKLLPEILDQKQAQAKSKWSQDDSVSGESKPSLRIWSAGCSTGEELYSLAIVLEEMNFPWHQWNTLLIGTDISKAAIETAQKGIYSKWSFRQVPPAIQQKYFYNHHQLFQVNDSIRRKVKFICGNLLKDTFPKPGTDLYDIDLILCRNVFIYLDSHAIGTIIQKFHKTLSKQGYLITGHTELYGQDISRFQVMSFPESVIYRQRNCPVPAPAMLNPTEQTSQFSLTSVTSQRKSCKDPRSSKPSLSSAPLGSVTSAASSLRSARRSRGDQCDEWGTALKEAEHLLKREAYDQAILSAEKIFSAFPQCDAAVKIAAHAYANVGSHEEAKSLCKRVLKRHPLSVDMYYLLAQIAEEQNELEITKNYLRKIIYLDSSFVRAYLDLASIYEREKQPDKTKKMQAYALNLLGKLPGDAVLDAHLGTTVAEWKKHLESQNLS